MSFDFAAGDIFKLGQAAFALFEACNNASDVFQETAEQCLSIYIAIGQTQKEFCSSDSKLDPSHYAAHVELSALTTNCRSTLARLEQVIGRYKSLATPAPTIWDTMRFAIRQLINDELAEIRSKLTIHLLSLNLFLARVQGDMFDVIVRKLDGMTGNLSPALPDLAAINHADNTIPHHQLSFLKDVGTGTPASQSRLRSSNQAPGQQNEDRITVESLHEAFKVKKEKLESLLKSTDDFQESLALMTAAEQEKPLLPPQEYHYSKTDERLSQLPEGWQRIKLNEQDYQYRYLFHAKDIRTRTYNSAKPFDVTIDVESRSLPEGWRESATDKRGSHYVHEKTGTSQFNRPIVSLSNLSENHFVGLKTRQGLPIDLEDICSSELARALNSPNFIPEEDIKSSLPQGWQWHLDEMDHPVYTYTGSKISPLQQYESSVHPAYFLTGVTGANHDTSLRLPIGWDRRLDTWGCIFYVDHNTKHAQRINPRDDQNIDLATGLPVGWEETKDHNGVSYFFERSTLCGTYRGIAMRAETMDEKFTLRSTPKRGDIPPIEGGSLLIQEHSLRANEADGLHMKAKSSDEFRIPITMSLNISGKRGRGFNCDGAQRRRNSI